MKKIYIFTFYFVCVFALSCGGFILLVNNLYPQAYLDIVNKYAKEYELSPNLVASVINVESSFNEKAISNKGAIGLMQLMPQTATWLNGKEISQNELFEPDINIRLGCKYLSQLIEQYEDLDTALACYNAGPVIVNQWLSSENYSQNGKLTNIPYPETQKYISKIKHNMKIYKLLLK